MLKRLYVRFLLWALGPVLSEVRINASQVMVKVDGLGSAPRQPKADWEIMLEDYAKQCF